MPVWKGIVGKGFRPDAFTEYVAALRFDAWQPRFVVVHNTSVPTFAEWHKVDPNIRMRNLESYYRDQQHWSAGPHLFVADDLIWVFTPLTVPGIHSPSYNPFSWGVEMVGEYDVEPLSPAVLANTVDALATLHARLGLDPNALKFHKEDPRTTHKDCPGKNVVKPDLIAAVIARMGANLEGDHEDSRDVFLSAAASVINPQMTSMLLPTGPTASQKLFTNITSTEFGGGSDYGQDGMDSAYGGKVDPDQFQASLPAKLSRSQRRIRVHHRLSGVSVDCLINDVGPWNKTDAYWSSGQRPQAEAQFRNRTEAQNGLVPSNDAGIDLTPAVFDAFGVEGAVNTRQTHVDWEFI